jgi:pimeloyl-ACP methyl ester carboxylesterase
MRGVKHKRLGLALVAGLCAMAMGCSGNTPKVPSSHFVGPHAHRNLIVFVHGVLGDMDNTWENPQTHASWPAMLAADLTNFDVFVYGYLSPISTSASDIYELAGRLGTEVRDRGFFKDYDQIYFITHSMGGLITKRFVDTLNTPAERANLERIRLVVYISVPASGANAAALANWISGNPQFRSMDPRGARDFLQATEGDWETLLRSRTPSSPFPLTFCAYETQPVGLLLVVPELYTATLSDANPEAFDYNHITIVKPSSTDDQVYRWVKARIVEASSKTVAAAQDSASPPWGIQPSVTGRKLFHAQIKLDDKDKLAQEKFNRIWKQGVTQSINSVLTSTLSDAPQEFLFEGMDIVDSVEPADLESLSRAGHELNGVAVAATTMQKQANDETYRTQSTFRALYPLPGGAFLSLPDIPGRLRTGKDFGPISLDSALSKKWGYYVVLALAARCLANEPKVPCDKQKMVTMLGNAAVTLGSSDTELSNDFVRLAAIAKGK